MCWSSALEPSRGGLELDSGEVFSALKIRRLQGKLPTRVEPTCRLRPRSLIDSLQPLVDFGWRPSREGLVWSIRVIPLNERDQLRAHRFETEGHRDDPLDPRGPTRTLDHNTDPDIAELARRERNGN